MQKQTQEIVKDIYRIDQTLKEHEASLIKVVDELILSKPYIKIDEAFVRQLRSRLEAKMALTEKRSVFTGFFPSLKLAYSLGALLIAALAFATFLYFNDGFDRPEQLVLNTGISKIGERAFGEIAFSAGENLEGEAQGLGGGGVPRDSASPMVTKGEYGIEEPYYFETINYNYIYNGEEFSVGESTMPVYKKSGGDAISSKLAGILGKVNLDILDVSKFRNAKIGSLQIVEDRDYGYSLFIDPMSNTVSINTNWERWPQDVYSGGLTEADSLTEDQILSIADSFVKEYKIDLSNYGPAEVLETEPILYMAEKSGEASSISYVRESYSVVYPLILDGKEVFNQSGGKTGMNVEVSARYKKVTYAGNIFTSGFESSDYDVETSVDKILSSAQKGGMNSYYSYPDPTKTVDVELGTPVFGLVSVWQATENKYMGEELYVPSLIFPITSNPEPNYYYGDSVVVPLVGIQQSNVLIRPMTDTGVIMESAETE
jgi:hypothetical protein